MSYIVAVDSGGTFSDCVAIDELGALTRAKAPSTPPEYERGVFAAISEVADRLGRSLEGLLGETAVFAHGTTIATNTLITRTGAKTALLTTKGHEDAIIIGRTVQKVAGLTEEEIIDVALLSKADPIVPRSLIFGIEERIDRAGQVVVPLNLDRLDEVGNQLRSKGVSAVAISLLWSFLNPEHERRLHSWLTSLPDDSDPARSWFVTFSSELVPVIREYERTSTTVLNAYLTPGVRGYLGRMGDRLRGNGYAGAIAVMHSAGGVCTVDEASRHGVTLLSSGPAGGMLGARRLADRLGFESVIATDVGGTSFDVGLIVGGDLTYAESPVFSKYPVALPVIDIASIGAGGGSIAWVEAETGVLRVGPQSAGASPGPACYGAGGMEPTLTDANVILGRINPDNFLGGRMQLDFDSATVIIRRRVAEPLALSVEEAAVAMADIADAHMADLIRRATVERGRDPTGFTVFGYGGAAGLHADAYASTLGCRHLVIPRGAAVFSAWGIAASEIKRVATTSDPASEPFDLERWQTRFARLEDRLRHEFDQDRLPATQLSVRWFANLQFRGQAHSVSVPVVPDDLLAGDGGEALIARFVHLYERRYGIGSAYRKAGVEVMAFVVEGVAPMPSSALEWHPLHGPSARPRPRGDRSVHLGGGDGRVRLPIYEAEVLGPGHEVLGPAIVEAEDTTVLVRPDHRMWVDDLLNLRIELGAVAA